MPISSSAVLGDFIPTSFYTHTTKLGQPIESAWPNEQINSDLSTVDNIPSREAETPFFNSKLCKYCMGILLAIIAAASFAIPLGISLSNSNTSTSTAAPTTASNTSSINSTTTTGTTTTTATTTTFTSSFRWNSTGVTLLGTAGLVGIASNHLDFPIGIVLGSSNTLYIADANNNRIQKILIGNTTATTMAGNINGVAGSNASLLNYPNDIAIDSSGNIYIVDSTNNRIELWGVNASSATTIAGNGTAGNSSTLLDSPRAIAFDSNPNIFYISDSNNNRVLKYTLNSTVGTVVAGGNGPGSSSTQLNNPRGLYFDSTTNSLLIANPGANNVVRWVIGATNWTLVAGNINGSSGTGSTSLNNPWDVTLDSMGNIYVADRYNNRIQFFLAGQMNGTTIGGVTSTSGTSSILLDEPLSVAVDSQLNVYVADSQNDRIQKFAHY